MTSSSSALPIILLLLVAASLVAVVVRRIRIPYTVGLVIVGIIVPSDALGLDTPTALSPSIVLPLLLPPLLFEAAFALRWDHLAPVAAAILILATTGVLLSAAVTGCVLVLVNAAALVGCSTLRSPYGRDRSSGGCRFLSACTGRA